MRQDIDRIPARPVSVIYRRGRLCTGWMYAGVIDDDGKTFTKEGKYAPRPTPRRRLFLIRLITG